MYFVKNTLGAMMFRMFFSSKGSNRCWLLALYDTPQWRTEGGVGVLNPPRNSEGPPKSCQIQPDCENC